VPLDPIQTPHVADSYAASAIENEIPAYRAILPRAIFALVLGVGAILCFVGWYFLPLAVLAVLIGFSADRKILRFPDLYIGRGFAQAGLGLGLVFGLTSVTIATAQTWIMAKQASDFGRGYADVLAKGTFEQIVWWGQIPSVRINNTPEKVVAEQTSSPMSAARFEEEHIGLRKLRKVLANPGASIHFEKLENSGVDELTPWGSAIYEVHTADEKEGVQYAAAIFKGVKNTKGVWEWWVEKVNYPAKLGSITAPAPKPVDDGHGHAH
jgi:hypothetical protein